MKAIRLFLVLISVHFLCAISGTAIAQDHKSESAYADFQQREIKALSADEITGLLKGDGLGMALPAELNGYPGPRHVLDLADDLDLSAEQEQDVTVIFEDMRARAASLGSEIVKAERELDRFFASSSIDDATLEKWVTKIAVLRGRLRRTHLEAHLKMVDLLNDGQRRHYQMLRGYGGHEHTGH